MNLQNFRYEQNWRLLKLVSIKEQSQLLIKQPAAPGSGISLWFPSPLQITPHSAPWACHAPWLPSHQPLTIWSVACHKGGDWKEGIKCLYGKPIWTKKKKRKHLHSIFALNAKSRILLIMNLTDSYLKFFFKSTAMTRQLQWHLQHQVTGGFSTRKCYFRRHGAFPGWLLDTVANTLAKRWEMIDSLEIWAPIISSTPGSSWPCAGEHYLKLGCVWLASRLSMQTICGSLCSASVGKHWCHYTWKSSAFKTASKSAPAFRCAVVASSFL